ncbi:MAG TPA: c-type cytochrome [Burkholderiales bacterium]|nr:c-type cytochrome [Burkholderiales bacterium]
MRLCHALSFGIAFATAVSNSSAYADPVAGGQRTASCAHCHGTDGNSSSGAYPTLAGQNKEYLYRQIKAFKEGSRKNSQMSPMVGILSDQEMQDIADFYNTQSPRPSTFKGDPAVIEQGKKLTAEAQCASCHLPNFKGSNEIPRLTRQKQPYLVKQLKDYRDGARTNDGGIMSTVVKSLTDEQIEAIAQYLATL